MLPFHDIVFSIYCSVEVETCVSKIQENAILLFYCNDGYVNPQQYYVTHALPFY